MAKSLHVPRDAVVTFPASSLWPSRTVRENVEKTGYYARAQFEADLNVWAAGQFRSGAARIPVKTGRLRRSLRVEFVRTATNNVRKVEITSDLVYSFQAANALMRWWRGLNGSLTSRTERDYKDWWDKNYKFYRARAWTIWDDVAQLYWAYDYPAAEALYLKKLDAMSKEERKKHIEKREAAAKKAREKKRKEVGDRIVAGFTKSAIDAKAQMAADRTRREFERRMKHVPEYRKRGFATHRAQRAYDSALDQAGFGKTKSGKRRARRVDAQKRFRDGLVDFIVDELGHLDHVTQDDIEILFFGPRWLEKRTAQQALAPFERADTEHITDPWSILLNEAAHQVQYYIRDTKKLQIAGVNFDPRRQPKSDATFDDVERARKDKFGGDVSFNSATHNDDLFRQDDLNNLYALALMTKSETELRNLISDAHLIEYDTAERDAVSKEIADALDQALESQLESGVTVQDVQDLLSGTGWAFQDYDGISFDYMTQDDLDLLYNALLHTTEIIPTQPFQLLDAVTTLIDAANIDQELETIRQIEQVAEGTKDGYSGVFIDQLEDFDEVARRFDDIVAIVEQHVGNKAASTPTRSLLTAARAAAGYARDGDVPNLINASSLALKSLERMKEATTEGDDIRERLREAVDTVVVSNEATPGGLLISGDRTPAEGKPLPDVAADWTRATTLQLIADTKDGLTVEQVAKLAEGIPDDVIKKIQQIANISFDGYNLYLRQYPSWLEVAQRTGDMSAIADALTSDARAKGYETSAIYDFVHKTHDLERLQDQHDKLSTFKDFADIKPGTLFYQGRQPGSEAAGLKRQGYTEAEIKQFDQWANDIGWWRTMYEHARNPDIDLTDGEQTFMQMIDDDMVELDAAERSRLYRGARFTPDTPGGFDFYDALQPGMLAELDNIPTSFSRSMEKANEFAYHKAASAPDAPFTKHVTMELYGQQGLKGLPYNANEAEVLIEKGARLYVVEVEDVTQDAQAPHKHVIGLLLPPQEPSTTETEDIDLWGGETPKFDLPEPYDIYQRHDLIEPSDDTDTDDAAGDPADLPPPPDDDGPVTIQEVGDVDVAPETDTFDVAAEIEATERATGGVGARLFTAKGESHPDRVLERSKAGDDAISIDRRIADHEQYPNFQPEGSDADYDAKMAMSVFFKQMGNEALNDGDYQLLENLDSHMADLSPIERSALYRGMTWDSGDPRAKEFYDSLEAGRVQDVPVAMSTAKSIEHAAYFAAPDKDSEYSVMLEMYGQEGVKGIVYNAVETEVMIQQGAQIKILAVYEDKKTKYKHVVASLVPPSDADAIDSDLAFSMEVTPGPPSPELDALKDLTDKQVLKRYVDSRESSDMLALADAEDAKPGQMEEKSHQERRERAGITPEMVKAVQRLADRSNAKDVQEALFDVTNPLGVVGGTVGWLRPKLMQKMRGRNNTPMTESELISVAVLDRMMKPLEDSERDTFFRGEDGMSRERWDMFAEGQTITMDSPFSVASSARLAHYSYTKSGRYELDPDENPKPESDELELMFELYPEEGTRGTIYNPSEYETAIAGGSTIEVIRVVVDGNRKHVIGRLRSPEISDGPDALDDLVASAAPASSAEVTPGITTDELLAAASSHFGVDVNPLQRHKIDALTPQQRAVAKQRLYDFQTGDNYYVEQFLDLATNADLLVPAGTIVAPKKKADRKRLEAAERKKKAQEVVEKLSKKTRSLNRQSNAEIIDKSVDRAAGSVVAGKDYRKQKAVIKRYISMPAQDAFHKEFRKRRKSFVKNSDYDMNLGQVSLSPDLQALQDAGEAVMADAINQLDPKDRAFALENNWTKRPDLAFFQLFPGASKAGRDQRERVAMKLVDIIAKPLEGAQQSVKYRGMRVRGNSRLLDELYEGNELTLDRAFKLLRRLSVRQVVWQRKRQEVKRGLCHLRGAYRRWRSRNALEFQRDGNDDRRWHQARDRLGHRHLPRGLRQRQARSARGST